MNDQPTPQNQESYMTKAIELVIRISVLILIIGWCFLIMAPFLSLIIWAVVIAVAVYPIFNTLKRKFGDRGKLAAVTVSGSFLLIILVPSILLGDSLYEGIRHLKAIYEGGNFTIPPPGESVTSWPAFTKPVVDLWTLASENLSDALSKFTPQIKIAGQWLLAVITGASLGILQFIGAILIAGVLLVYSKEGGGLLRNIFIRLAGQRGADFAVLSEVTIRNVVKGVLGVAFIQTMLAGIGFVVAGIPLAGLWILLCLISAIVQIGVGPIVIPAVVYMFVTADTLPAILFLIWSILVTLSDNVLKPFLLGKGAPVPMLVVFLGSIGGFIANGFIGLFIGPVILSLGYKLFLLWADKKPEPLSIEP
ncbi:MAG: AI-2E family transporter [Bacteroidota bacterium]